MYIYIEREREKMSLFSNLHYMTETQSDMNCIIRKRF